MFIVAAACMSVTRRNKALVYHAQAPFICLFLSGLLAVIIAAVLGSVEPSDWMCISMVWFKNTGYTVAFVLLALKVDSINRLVSSGKHMQRVRLSSRSLWVSYSSALTAVAVFLFLWTSLDPTLQHVDYELTEDLTSAGETIISARKHCASESSVWVLLSLGWQGLLLLYTGVIAFLASRVQEELNGARNLAKLALSHGIFLALRTVVHSTLENTLETRGLYNLILIADCFLAVLIYVAPKLYHDSDDQKSDEAMPDLFVATTIFLADIVGFTQWSSMREASAVFRFLEIVRMFSTRTKPVSSPSCRPMEPSMSSLSATTFSRLR